ncbi:MAG TPA: tRNA pseudouridine(55) synthase TruB [Candidatus Saccharimonadales bacterium]
MDGLLLIDKPLNWTSFDVVNKVKSLIATQSGLSRKSLKVGHAGTLDPLASGLLLVVVGSTCKQAGRLAKLPKTYRAEIKLGFTTKTDDAEGEKQPVSDKKPDKALVDTALRAFLGPQWQKPPIFSAVKIGGQRAYKLARRGISPAIKTKMVEIKSIKLISYTYPLITLECDVSSGTYIRSLARDLGQKLGCGAYLSGLRRLSVGQYLISAAVTLEQLDKGGVQANLSNLE